MITEFLKTSVMNFLLVHRLSLYRLRAFHKSLLRWGCRLSLLTPLMLTALHSEAQIGASKLKVNSTTMIDNAVKDTALIMDDFIKQPYTVVSSEKDAAADEFILLSSIKKVNGKWRAKKRERFLGQINSRMLEFDSIDIQSVRDAIAQYAKHKKWSLVYDCQGLDCGRSHAWANEIFKRRRLTGIDATQSYSVWRSTPSAGDWHIVYLIERGDRRIYLYSQTLLTSSERETSSSIGVEGKAEEKNQQLLENWQQGFAILLSMSSVTKEEKRALDKWLPEQATKRFWVVGHSRTSGFTLEQQQLQALGSAKVRSEELMKKWPQYQFEPYSVGPLAPRVAVSQGQHIELIPAN